jgi:hypothetical protein
MSPRSPDKHSKVGAVVELSEHCTAQRLCGLKPEPFLFTAAKVRCDRDDLFGVAVCPLNEMRPYPIWGIGRAGNSSRLFRTIQSGCETRRPSYGKLGGPVAKATNPTLVDPRADFSNPIPPPQRTPYSIIDKVDAVRDFCG